MNKSIYSPQSEIFSNRMKQLRKEAGLNQRELAKKLDTLHNTVARIELGERRLDVIEYIHVLKTLNLDPKEEFSNLIDLIEKRGN